MRVLISGSTGRMGSSVKKILEEKNLTWTYGFTKTPQDSKETNQLENIDPKDVDVVIDFSLPESFEKIFFWCSEHQIPLVSGTTGFDLKKYEKVNFPFLHTGNFSIGVALLKESVQNMSMLDDAKIWIEDVHHINKQDAPSGTALLLQKAVGSEDVEIHSIRGGSVFGVHRVHAVTESEWLTFTHQALNREVFARGAVKVGLWLMNQSAGAYELGDFLKS